MKLVLAMALVAQFSAGGSGGFRDMSGEGPSAYPTRWRYDVTAAMQRLARDAASLNASEIAPPILKADASGKRYLACMRMRGRTSLDAAPGLREYVGTFSNRGVSGIRRAAPGECAEAQYAPFPEERSP